MPAWQTKTPSFVKAPAHRWYQDTRHLGMFQYRQINKHLVVSVLVSLGQLDNPIEYKDLGKSGAVVQLKQLVATLEPDDLLGDPYRNSKGMVIRFGDPSITCQIRCFGSSVARAG